MTTGVSIDTKQNNGELIARDTASAAHFSAPFGLILHFSPGVCGNTYYKMCAHSLSWKMNRRTPVLRTCSWRITMRPLFGFNLGSSQDEFSERANWDRFGDR